MGDEEVNELQIIVPGRDDDAISNSLRRLTERVHKAGLADAGGWGLGGEFGYGVNFENDTFLMHRYCWCEREDCLWCGLSQCQVEVERTGHGPACYQTELRARMEAYEVKSGYRAADEAAFGKHDDPQDKIASMLFGNARTESPAPGVIVMVSEPRRDDAHKAWSKAYGAKRKFEDALYRELCEKHGVGALGCAIHCTCGADDDWRRRYDACQCDWHLGRGVYRFGKAAYAPHFWHKPSNTQIRWYKYIGRDMKCDIKAEWHTIIRECFDSIKKG